MQKLDYGKYKTCLSGRQIVNIIRISVNYCYLMDQMSINNSAKCDT